MELADTSAWTISRRVGGVVKREFDKAVVRRRTGTCDMVRLELLQSARSHAEFTFVASRLDAVADCPIGKPQWQRALWVYGRLAEQGGAHQRSVGHADLLIAAAAESADATILHYDEDYERIAAITGQLTRWIVPRGARPGAPPAALLLN
jgi:predicted nucleic acid-binding protein